MKLFRLQWLAVCTLLILASCSKSNKQGRYIPENAAMVMHVNGESISAKLPWDEIKGNAVFQHAYADTNMPQFLKPVLDNPDNSGIDIKKDLLVFFVKDSVGSYIGITGSVKDVAKFKSFNLESSKGGSASEKDGISYISKDPACVGWDKDKFIYVINTPQFDRATKYGNTDESEQQMSRDNHATCAALFALKEGSSLAKDEKFSTLMGKKGDIHFWMNTEQFYGGMEGMAALSMIKLDKLYQGSYTTATATFENGKIDVEYKGYVGKAMKDVVKKYSGGKLDEAMLKRIPAQNVAAAFAFHFKPEGIRELLKALELEPIVNMGLAFAGFSMDDFIKANKGDIMMALTEFKMIQDSISFPGLDGKTSTIKHERMEPQFIFAAAVGDKDAFGKIIKAVQKTAPDEGSNKMAYNTSNGFFALSNNKEMVEKYIAGNSNNNFEFISKVSGNPFGGFANIRMILQSMEKQATVDSNDIAIYQASLQFWDNVYITGGDYSDGGMSYKMEINLQDKNTNSLKQLNKYLGVIGKEMERRKKEEAAFMPLISPADTAVVVTPVPEAPIRRK